MEQDSDSIALSSAELLSREELANVFSYLDSRDVCSVACVQRGWREAADGEELWRHLLKDRFLVDDKCIPYSEREDGMPPGRGDAAPTYKACYRAWHAIYGSFEAESFKRVHKAWKFLGDYMARHLPEVHESLRPGAMERRCDDVAEQLGQPSMHPSIKLMYMMHDGQDLPFDKRIDCNDGAHLGPTAAERRSIFHGVFGGYSFYDHLINVRMLPLARALAWTTRVRNEFGLGVRAAERGLLLIAAAQNFQHMIFADMRDGGVRVICRPSAGAVEGGGDMQYTQRAAPEGCDAGDWFSTFVHRVETGDFRITELPTTADHISHLLHGVPRGMDTRALNQFPEDPAHTSTAVTRGVRVRASSLYVAEQSLVGQPFFAYSVRFDLLPEEEQRRHWRAADGPFRANTCVQLQSRHWVITDATGKVEEVSGDAVIGEYPTLRCGEKPYVYQSCTGCAAPGMMEGGFTFIEGTIAQPNGIEFYAVCAKFDLTMPDYVF